MNANELADKCGLMIGDYGFAIKVRTMLRQQQLEIETLKVKLKSEFDYAEKLLKERNNGNISI